MHLRNRLLLTLAGCGAFVSGAAVAHPGHQHEPGLLAAVVHAVTGWDQLLILLAACFAVGYLALRQR